ncbi:MAG: HAD family hydrolase [Bilifractor sp.]
MIKACIFDLDGTLTKTQESIARPVNMTLQYFGLPAMPVENYNYYAGDGLDNALKRALKDAGDPELKHYEEGRPLCRKWFVENSLYKVKPYPHILEMIRELKKRGIRLAVFSNKMHQGAIDVVQTIFGQGTFDHIQGQTDTVPIKPNPQGVYEILREFHLTREEVLYFGDTNTDMRTGHNAGVYTVGVTWGFRPRKELEEYKADWIVDDPMEIVDLVDRMNWHMRDNEGPQGSLKGSDACQK